MPGLAHFVEHIISQNIPNWEFDQVKEFFETCGGRAEFGVTNYLSTRYRFTVPTNLPIFRQALEIFGSMLLESEIEKDIERERKVIFQEFSGRYPNPDALGWDMSVRNALFQGHRLQTYNRPIGRPEGFLSTTGVDLQRFYDKHYVPANISLVVIGGLETNKMISELVKSPFGMGKNGNRTKIPQPLKQLPIPKEHALTVKLSDHVSYKVDQTKYKATWAFPYDFPSQARRVFDSVLEKILRDEIRESRGLAYSVGTDYVGYQDLYVYEIIGTVSPSATPYINELVRNCIEAVPSRRDLFDRKLKSLKQMCMMIDLSGSSLAGNVGSNLSSIQRIISIQEVWDDLHKITFEQMEEAASLLSSERQFTFMTCP